MIELYEPQKRTIDKLNDKPWCLVSSGTGSGKSIVGYLLARQWGGGPKLIVCTSILAWTKTFKMFGMAEHEWCALDIKKPDDFDFALRMQMHGSMWYVLTWSQVSKWQDELRKVRWGSVIADECHSIQDRNSLRSKAMKRIGQHAGTKRIALTATPASNYAHNIWSVLHWCDKKEWSSYWQFVDRYIDVYVGYGGYKKLLGMKPEMVKEFRERIEPYFVDYTLDEVVGEGVIPDGVFSVVEVELGSIERSAYDAMRTKSIAELNDGSIVLAVNSVGVLQRLQQMALGTCYLDDLGKMQIGRPSTKISKAVELTIDELRCEGAVVIYSQFRSALQLTQDMRKEQGVRSYLVMGGQGSRDEAERLFETGRIDVLLLSYGAGSESNTLNRATRWIALDRAWSVKTNEQAEGRVRRIGKTFEVEYIDIVAKDTVDRPRGVKLQRKKKWIKDMLGGI